VTIVRDRSRRRFIKEVSASALAARQVLLPGLSISTSSRKQEIELPKRKDVDVVKSWPFGRGQVVCNLSDGSVIRIEHPQHPGMSFLLGEKEADWHQAPSAWGKGFLLTSQEGGRWDCPNQIEVRKEGVDCNYEVIDGVRLQAKRRFGQKWTESYRLINDRDSAVVIASLAVSTPFRDVYASAKDSLTFACHAHIWTGGAYSYVWAVPMNGSSPALALFLTAGELWSYSIETRNQSVGSNIRGHIYLHVTDFGRSPHAMGGQPEIRVKPGGSFDWAWELDWFENLAEFEREKLRTPFTLPELSALDRKAIHIVSNSQTEFKVKASPQTKVSKLEGSYQVFSRRRGIEYLDITWGQKSTRVAVLFHAPLRTIVEQRVNYILAHHRATERTPSRRGSFLPVDTDWRLRLQAGNWKDWSDGRERIAMPLLLQHAHRLGWGQQNVLDSALSEYDSFVRKHLVGSDGTVYEDSFHQDPRRLYNYAWFAEFYVGQFAQYQDPRDALLSASVLENYYQRGGGKFLAFIDCAESVIEGLVTLGENKRAAALKKQLIDQVNFFLDRGMDLPSHEVAYEQSIVAPLLLLILTAQRLQPAKRYEEALREILPWLRAFAGQQPHVRLRNIPIRHWDGYWFGRYRYWGDVFPHYWSVLSAAVFAKYYRIVGESAAPLAKLAKQIFRANLCSFHEDGSATCAFIFPSCVDGNPAHKEDPVANDQDWALVWYLKYPELWPD